MTEQNRDDMTLGALFQAAQGQAESLPDPLFARILADAAEVRAARATPAPRAAHRSWLVDFGVLLGGWPSMAGLATAAVAGLWIGVAQPLALDGFALVTGATAAGFELDTLMPGVDVLASGD